MYKDLCCFPFFENKRGIPHPSIQNLQINGEGLIAPRNNGNIQVGPSSRDPFAFSSKPLLPSFAVALIQIYGL